MKKTSLIRGKFFYASNQTMKSIQWLGDRLRLIDQTQLPGALTYLDCQTADDVAEAIAALKVRGAPAIGVAAAYGAALAALASSATSFRDWLDDVDRAVDRLRRTRPTAVNLGRALDQVRSAAGQATSISDGVGRILAVADGLAAEDRLANYAIARLGAGLIPEGARILTHCNTGALATTEHGTALGVIRTAHRQGKQIHVWVDETRPAWQGARLTAWELGAEGIAHTLIADSAAGWLMRQGKVDLVIVGADRVAANGDVANKVGTYSLAVLARTHGIPFYVAAPVSSIDLAIGRGDGIPIEERSPNEVRLVGGVAIAPAESPVFNPAFDVTPSELITAIVTNRGIARAPYEESLRALVGDSTQAPAARLDPGTVG